MSGAERNRLSADDERTPDSTPDVDDGRLFTSAVASPAELMQRVQARLSSAAAPAAAPFAGDGVFDLASDAALLGGFYFAESFAGVPTRWTKRRFQFSAEVGTATHLELEALLPAEAGFAELRARLFVDDRAGEAFRFRPGWNRLHVPLPAGLSGPAHFVVDCGGAWCPLAQSLGEDQRELAVCVRRLALVRLDLGRQVDIATPPANGVPTRRATDRTGAAAVRAETSPRPRRRFDREWLRSIDQIPDLQERAVAVQARFEELKQHCVEAEAQLEARLSALESHANQVAQTIGQLVTLLDARFAALEAAQREQRTDLNAVLPPSDGEP